MVDTRTDHRHTWTPAGDGLCTYAHHDTPHTAEYGHLCAWCWQRLHADLIDAPTLIAHLRDVGEPNAARKPLTSDPSHHGDPSEGDPDPAAWQAADEVHANLASWALLIMEEHPGRLRGPKAGTWMSMGRDDVDRDTGEPYHSDAAPVGMKPGGDTAVMVRWLLPLLPWVSSREWAVEMRTEVASIVRTTMARWPVAETRTRNIPDVPCPRCDCLGLTYTPPALFKAPFIVACTNPMCGRVFMEDEWSRLVGLVARKDVV